MKKLFAILAFLGLCNGALADETGPQNELWDKIRQTCKVTQGQALSPVQKTCLNQEAAKAGIIAGRLHMGMMGANMVNPGAGIGMPGLDAGGMKGPAQFKSLREITPQILNRYLTDADKKQHAKEIKTIESCPSCAYEAFLKTLDTCPACSDYKQKDIETCPGCAVEKAKDLYFKNSAGSGK